MHWLDSPLEVAPFIQENSKADDVVVYAYIKQVLLKNICDYFNSNYVNVKLIQKPEYLHIIFL